MRAYSFNDLAGCVEQRRARETGTLVGLYHGEQSGMEDDPEHPCVTVCEAHHTLVAHPTLALARSHMPAPTGWCEECRETERMRALLETRPHGCASCGKTAHVDAMQRSDGKWTCYACGRINRLEKTS